MGFFDRGLTGRKLKDNEEYDPTDTGGNWLTGRKIRKKKLGGVAALVKINTDAIKDPSEDISYLNPPPAKKWW
jgi:hypothetical protein